MCKYINIYFCVSSPPVQTTVTTTIGCCVRVAPLVVEPSRSHDPATPTRSGAPLDRVRFGALYHRILPCAQQVCLPPSPPPYLYTRILHVHNNIYLHALACNSNVLFTFVVFVFNVSANRYTNTFLDPSDLEVSIHQIFFFHPLSFSIGRVSVSRISTRRSFLRVDVVVPDYPESLLDYYCETETENCNATSQSNG